MKKGLYEGVSINDVTVGMPHVTGFEVSQIFKDHLYHELNSDIHRLEVRHYRKKGKEGKWGVFKDGRLNDAKALFTEDVITILAFRKKFWANWTNLLFLSKTSEESALYGHFLGLLKSYVYKRIQAVEKSVPKCTRNQLHLCGERKSPKGIAYSLIGFDIEAYFADVKRRHTKGEMNKEEFSLICKNLERLGNIVKDSGFVPERLDDKSVYKNEQEKIEGKDKEINGH